MTSFQVMFKARDLFNNYLVELQGQHCDSINEQKHVAADIYFEFSQVYFLIWQWTQGVCLPAVSGFAYGFQVHFFLLRSNSYSHYAGTLFDCKNSD